MAEFYRRRLPHLSLIGHPVFLTWRLQGSLPDHRAFADGAISGPAFVAMDSLLDQARIGLAHLRRPELAAIITQAIRHGEADMCIYKTHAYVVMPNHVHLLITPQVELSRITHSLKRHTARIANQILGLTGQSFWQPESYDHLVHGDREFRHIQRYIEWNPVKAGLASSPERFPHAWSEPHP